MSVSCPVENAASASCRLFSSSFTVTRLPTPLASSGLAYPVGHSFLCANVAPYASVFLHLNSSRSHDLSRNVRHDVTERHVASSTNARDFIMSVAKKKNLCTGDAIALVYGVPSRDSIAV